MDFKEIYCNNCKKTLGRYNAKYFSDSRIAELIKSNHTSHYRKAISYPYVKYPDRLGVNRTFL